MSNFGLREIITLIVTILLAFQFSSAYAVDYGIFPPGNAAVTAFSGIVNTPTDNTLFDSNGPSMRIITLPGSNPFGLRDSAKPFTVFNRDVGQVFGIATDNASEPNIYVAATSAYGLAIYKPDQGRLKQGAADAQFMPGQFGPNGGPNSIWRIDGKTGRVTLFANVVYSGINDAPASLGALAFDPVNKQIFVSDRSSGMIHRFSMSGVENGIYDHGVQGLAAAGLPTIAFDPATVANITLPNFDVEKPETWGYAPKQRRVFALAVYDARLYYSAYGSQIWSVRIASDGSFTNDIRMELDIPVLLPDTEISSIAFDHSGYLYIAERGAPTGDYNFINTANSGQNRVKRFSPKIPDNFSPYYWRDPGNEYALGMPPEYQNSDGGVAVTCERNIWMTGDHLLDDGGFGVTHIDGLQGNDKSLVKPANMPPLQSVFVNYYDVEADSNSRGHMGAMVARIICGGSSYRQGIPTSQIQPPPLGLITPLCVPRIIFWFGCNCLYDNGTTPPQTDWLFPAGGCNSNCFSFGFPGFYDGGLGFEGEFGGLGGFGGFSGGFGFGGFVGGFGVFGGFEGGFGFGLGFGFGSGLGLGYGYDGYCTPGFCVPIYVTCYPYCFSYDSGYTGEGSCYTGTCSSFFGCGCSYGFPLFDPWWPMFDYCNCPYFNGPCLPPPPLCPPEYTYNNGQCVPPPTSCPPGETYTNGECTPPTCPPGQTYTNGQCNCPQGQTNNNGECIPTTPPRTPPSGTPPETTCPPGKNYYNGRCLTPPNTTCRKGLIYQNGHCVTPPTTNCGTNQRLINGRCVAICGTGQRMVNGTCITAPFCGTNYRYVNGKCVPICENNQQLINGRCVTPPGTRNPGQTSPHCNTNQLLVNGKCITPPTTCRRNQHLIHGRCVTSPTCGTNQRMINGKCVNQTICRSDQYLINGRCTTKPSTTTCGKNQRLVHGHCMTIEKPGTTKCGRGQVLRNNICITMPNRNIKNNTPINLKYYNDKYRSQSVYHSIHKSTQTQIKTLQKYQQPSIRYHKSNTQYQPSNKPQSTYQQQLYQKN